VSFELLLLLLAQNNPETRSPLGMEQKLTLHTKIQRHRDLLIFLGIFLFLASKSCLVADVADFLLIRASLFAA